MANRKPYTLCKKYLSSENKKKTEMVNLKKFISEKGFLTMYNSLLKLESDKKEIKYQIETKKTSIKGFMVTLKTKIQVGDTEFVPLTVFRKMAPHKKTRMNPAISEFLNNTSKSTGIKTVYTAMLDRTIEMEKLVAKYKVVSQEIKKLKTVLDSVVKYP
jgi:hypothetical protein